MSIANTARVSMPATPTGSQHSKSKPSFVARMLAVIGLVLTCATVNAQNAGPPSLSQWQSLDPKATTRTLGNFQPGEYMIYVANSDPNGRVVSRWNSYGPLALRANEVWDAGLMPSAQLRMERIPATSGPPTGPATIRVRNGDIAAWQSICVLPVGVNPRPSCFGGSMNVVDGGEPSTHSPWTSITPDRRQFATQPGGVVPLIVKDYPNFLAGEYMIYVANSDPGGTTISRWNTFGPVMLKGQDKWVAVLLRNAQLRLEKNEAALLSYSTPDTKHAMIYTRNDDLTSWYSICVLPVGMKVENECFGGSNNVVHVAAKPTQATAPHQPSAPANGPSKPVPQPPSAGAPTSIGHDGVFTGHVTIKRGDAKPGTPGTIELSVKDGKVSGTMTWPPTRARITARILGVVGADLRMTAKVEGNSEWLGNKPTGYSGSYDAGKAAQANIDALMQSVTTYPFSGDLTGTFDRNAWTGAYQVRSTDQRKNPVELRGTWKAAPKK